VVLGVISAHVGGAPVARSVLRVLFWGVAAMLVTAAIGRLTGTAV